MAVSWVAVFIALGGSALALQANSVGPRHIRDNAVRSTHIKDGQVKNQDVRNLGWGKLSGVPAGFADGVDNTGGGGGPASDVQCTGCVQTADLANGAVNAGKLAGNSVSSVKVADGTLGAADLGADSVNASELAANAVRTGEILNGQVGTVDLADNAADSRVIANGGVRTSDINDNTVTHAKMSSDARPRWAVIFDSGPVDALRGVTGSTRLETGLYRVSFDRAIGDCSITTTAQRAGGLPRLATFGATTSTSTSVLVATERLDGSRVDATFHIQVLC